MDLKYCFNQYGSDKIDSGYIKIYDRLLSPFRNEYIKLLEIGVGTLTHGPSNMRFTLNEKYRKKYLPGDSLRSFRDYFIFGEIYGIDIQQDCVISEDRIITYICDSQNSEMIDYLFKDDLFDFIIDDGAHMFENQILTLSNFYKKLKIGGIYFIEDVVEHSKLINYLTLNNYKFEITDLSLIIIYK
jgi:hypothetical protein